MPKNLARSRLQISKYLAKCNISESVECDYNDYLNSKEVKFIIKVNQHSVDYSEKIDFMIELY